MFGSDALEYGNFADAELPAGDDGGRRGRHHRGEAQPDREPLARACRRACRTDRGLRAVRRPARDRRGGRRAARAARRARRARSSSARKGAYDTALDAALAEAGFTEVALGAETGALEAALRRRARSRARPARSRSAAQRAGRAARAGPRAAGADRARAARTTTARCASRPHARTLLVLDGDEARVGSLAPGDVTPVRSNFSYPVAASAPRRGGAASRSAPGSGERLLRVVARRARGGGARRDGRGARASRSTTSAQRGSSGARSARSRRCSTGSRTARCRSRARAGSRYEAAAQARPRRRPRSRRRTRARRRTASSRETHQLSGAMGYTREHDLHVFSMRLQALRLELGGAGAQRRAVARARWGAARVSLDLELDDGAAGDRRRGRRFCAIAAARRCGAHGFPDALWRELARHGVLALATPEGEGGAPSWCAALRGARRRASSRAARRDGDLRCAAAARGGARARRRRARRSSRSGVPPLLPFAPERAASSSSSTASAPCAREPRGAVERRRDARRRAVGPGRARARRGAAAARARALALHDARARRAARRGRPARARARAAEHARTRKQFGRALGEFQAVAHPLADCAIRISAARDRSRAPRPARVDAAAPEAARAAPPRRGSRRARAALDAAHVAHQVFGARGHHARRAGLPRLATRCASSALAAAGEPRGARGAARAARGARAMNSAFAPEEEAFRAEVREFLADWRDLDAFFLQGRKWPRVRALFRALGERGWLSLGWPARPAAGWAARRVRVHPVGRGRLRARGAEAARVGHRGAKTIARHGDDAQRRALAAADPRRRAALLARLLGARGRLRSRERCAAAPSGAATATS